MPVYHAMPLRRWRAPFDDNGWAFALKYDGFRVLVFVERRGALRLADRRVSCQFEPRRVQQR